MTIQVSEALDSDTAVLITLVDSTGGSYVDGIFQPGPTIQRKALASFQQPTAQQLEYLEGSEKHSNVQTVYLNQEVSLSEDGSLSTTIIRNGKQFKVIHVGDWNDYGYFFAMAVEQ